MSFSGMQNLLYVKEVNTPNRFGGIGYIGFEKLTFVPIQVYKQCSDLSLRAMLCFHDFNVKSRARFIFIL